jgi:hypothetical protein
LNGFYGAQFAQFWLMAPSNAATKSEDIKMSHQYRQSLKDEAGFSGFVGNGRNYDFKINKN